MVGRTSPPGKDPVSPSHAGFLVWPGRPYWLGSCGSPRANCSTSIDGILSATRLAALFRVGFGAVFGRRLRRSGRRGTPRTAGFGGGGGGRGRGACWHRHAVLLES